MISHSLWQKLNLGTLEAAAEAAPTGAVVAEAVRRAAPYERDTRAPVIPGGVAQTTIFFTAGRNGIGELLREMEKKRLFFFWSATRTRNKVEQSEGMGSNRCGGKGLGNDAVVGADSRGAVVGGLHHRGGVVVEKLWSCGHAKPELEGFAALLLYTAGILLL